MVSMPIPRFMLAKMPRSVLRAIRLRLSAAAILLKYMILLLPAAKSLLMKGRNQNSGDQSHGVDARYDGTLIELKKTRS